MINRIYNIRAPVFLNLIISLRKRDKMLGNPSVLSLFPNLLNKFNENTVTSREADYSICGLDL